jgi:hypothetical protein
MGLGDRDRNGVESIELAGIGNKLQLLEHVPNCLIGQLGMAMRLGVGDALIEQPGVQLVVVLEA